MAVAHQSFNWNFIDRHRCSVYLLSFFLLSQFQLCELGGILTSVSAAKHQLRRRCSEVDCIYSLLYQTWVAHTFRRWRQKEPCEGSTCSSGAITTHTNAHTWVCNLQLSSSLMWTPEERNTTASLKGHLFFLRHLKKKRSFKPSPAAQRHLQLNCRSQIMLQALKGPLCMIY